MKRIRSWVVSAVMSTCIGVALPSLLQAQSIATDVSIQVSSSDMAIPAAGTMANFVVMVSNLGSSGNYFQNHVVVHFPSEYTEVSWVCTEQVTPSSTAGSCTSANDCHPPACPVPNTGTGNIDVDAGLRGYSSVIFTVKARVPVNTPNPLRVTASVTPASFVIDPNAGNNSSTISLFKSADVQLSVKASTNPSVGHETIFLTPNVCNGGPWAADNVSLKLGLSPGVSVVSAGGEGWGCAVLGQQVSCQQPTLPQGSCSSMLVGIVPEPGIERIALQTLVAVAGLTTDPNTINNTVQGQLSVSRPDMPSLNGGGFGCSAGVQKTQNGFFSTLMMFSVIGVVVSLYRAYRRKQQSKSA